jgi:putative PIN family toxin of toxin-antitoxin system
MQRYVIDTCIFVSGLRSKNGASNALLRLVSGGLLRPIVTIALFLEYKAVLKRPEHRLASGMSLERIDHFLAALASACEGAETNFRWRPQLSDPNDEMVLEAALNGSATSIVTHNIKDFRHATTQFGVEIISPQEAIRRITL